MEPKLYVTANTGFLINASNDTMMTSSVGIGGRLEKNGYYTETEFGTGKVTYVKAGAGKDIAFGSSKFGLNTSVGGQYTVENRSRDYYGNIYKSGANSPEWKANDLRGYGQVSLSYNTPVFKASIGVRGGVKTSVQPSLEGITLAKIGEIKGAEYPGRTTKTTFNPVLELEAGNHAYFSMEMMPDNTVFSAKFYF